MNNNIQQILKSFGEAIKIFFDQNQELIRAITEGLQKMPDNIKLVQDKLFRRGWYVLSDFDLNYLVEINEVSDNELDRLMVDHVSTQYQSTFEKLVLVFPSRAEILKDCMWVHEQRRYSISVPIMLIIADGITFDMFGVSLFSKTNGEPKTKFARKKVINNCDDESIMDIFYLRPLDIVTSISMNTEKLESINKNDVFYGPLNRHKIIHGHDTQYGTEENSYRCIVLLSYLMEIKNYYLSK